MIIYIEFEITMINILKSLLEIVYNMQKQMDNVSREIETLRIKSRCQKLKTLQ